MAHNLTIGCNARDRARKCAGSGMFPRTVAREPISYQVVIPDPGPRVGPGEREALRAPPSLTPFARTKPAVTGNKHAAAFAWKGRPGEDGPRGGVGNVRYVPLSLVGSSP